MSDRNELEQPITLRERILMWGYLPAASPQRTALHHPMPVPPPSHEEGWKSICSGGCGFALAISESGKFNTWGSTDDLGQSYVTSGKHEERPEPFPLPSDVPIIQGAAGWAHCAVVTEKGEVFTWGWKECVPTTKSSMDQAANALASADKDLHESQAEGKDRGEEGMPVSVQLTDQLDCPELLPITAASSTLRNKGNGMASGVKAKVPSPVDKLRGGLPSSSSKSQAGKMPRIPSAGSLTGFEKTDEGTKKRRVTVEQTISSESSTMANDENVSAPPCLVALHPGVKIVSVAAGGRHTLALSDTGQVWGWGYGGEGQLGLGSRIRTVSSPHPVQCIESASPYWQDLHVSTSKGNKNSDIPLLHKVPGNYVKAVACGGRHSAVLTEAGALLTFGWGLYGQCGQGSTDDEVSPCYVSSLGGLAVAAVAAGLWHTVCITESGDVYSFGGNQFGQLGTGGDQAEMFPRLVEAPVLENQHAVSVSCGARHSAICTDTGNVFCWGWNKYGQLGLGDAVDRSIPAEVPLEGSFARDVACGWWHTLALVHPG